MEQEFQRLSNTGQERGDGQQTAAYRRPSDDALSAPPDTSPAPHPGQTKHHDWEEAGHEHTCGAVTGIEAVDVTRNTVPAALVNSPIWNQAMVFST